MSSSKPFVGRIIGNYVLRDPIGEGGMASVFSAEHRFLGDRVAIKLMRNTHAGNPMLKKRFFEEAKTARQIEHPNITKVVDFGELPEDGTLYLVMELLEGRNLSALIARGPIPEATAASIAGSVANALVAVHDKGVIHRDLKPDNIFVCNSGQVKILDFGLAKALSNPDETAVGTILGTPQYMAPEQAKKDMRVGPYTDIYGLGVVLFKMLASRLPFLAADRFQMMAQHVLKAPPRPSEFAPVSEVMDGIVLRCLEKDPARRFPSMAALRDRLMIVAAGVKGDGDDTLVSDDDETPSLDGPRTDPVPALDPASLPPRDVDVREWMHAVQTLPLPRPSSEEVLAARSKILSQQQTELRTALHDPLRPRDPDATVVRDEGRSRRRLFFVAGVGAFLVAVAIAGVVVGFQVRGPEVPASSLSVDGIGVGPAAIPAPGDLASLAEGSDAATAVVVTIRSRPTGARLSIDGISYGPTPVTLPMVLPRELRLVAPGHRPTRAIVDHAGDIEVRLPPAGAKPSPEQTLD